MSYDPIWTPQRKKTAVRRLVGAVFFMMVSCGCMFGFNALKPVLIAKGLYRSKCLATEPIPCSEQLSAINWILQFASATLNMCALVYGPVLDYLGSQRSSLIAATLWTLSTIALGFPETVEPVYDFIYCLWGVSGALWFFSALRMYRTTGPDLKHAVSPVLTVAWDIASLTLVAVAALFYVGVSLPAIFIGWAFIGLCMLVFSFFVFKRVDEETEEDSTHIAVPSLDLVPYLKSKTMAALAFEMITVLLIQNVYMSTLSEQALWITNGDIQQRNGLVNSFNYILPAMAIPTFLIVTFVDKKTGTYTLLPLQRLSMAVICIIWVILSIVPRYELQILTYALFAAWRITCFSLLYSTVKLLFSERYFGRLAAMCFAPAGSFALLAPLIELEIVADSAGNPTVVNLCLGAFAVVGHVVGAIFTADKHTKRMRDHVIEEGQPLTANR